MKKCHQCQYPNQTEICNYCGEFINPDNVYNKYVNLENERDKLKRNEKFFTDDFFDEWKESKTFNFVLQAALYVLGTWLVILVVGILFFNLQTTQFVYQNQKLCFSLNEKAKDNCLIMLPSFTLFTGYEECKFPLEEKINNYKGYNLTSKAFVNFFESLYFGITTFFLWTAYFLVGLILFYIIDFLFLRLIERVLGKYVISRRIKATIKEINSELAALKPQYEKLKLLLNTDTKYLKQAISTSYLQIIRLNYELIDTGKIIDESQNSRVISEQERSQILENLKSIQQQLKTNYSKFIAHFTELKLIYHLSYFELLRVNYEKEGEVDEQEIDTLINEIKKTEDFILPIASNVEKVKLGKFKSLVLKYKKLDEREALQAKLAKVSAYIKKGEAQINPEVSGDLDFEFMLAESYEKYHEKYWNDYEKLGVPS